MKFTFPPESRPLEGYTIKRAIHRGGFGEVYYALSDAGKEVALKLLQQHLEIELRGVRQCLNLKHPNLVTTFDIRTDGDGDHWIVMEYIAGRTLDRVLDDSPAGLPMDEVEAWLSGIVAGLSYLHDHGIVHRDLKPANIYRDYGVVKTGDVGLSKFISESRRSAQTESVGTVHYMAPEISRGNYGREVDIYALGVILYEMITGRVPFSGESTGEILMKHLTEQPDLTLLPERLRPVLARALAKDPQQRTATAAELESDFRHALHHTEHPVDLPDDSFVADAPVATAAGPGLVWQAKELKRHARKARDAAYKAGREMRKAAKYTIRAERERQKAIAKAAKAAAYQQQAGAVARPQSPGVSVQTARPAKGSSSFWFWGKAAAIVIVALALFSPHTLSGMARPLFMSGVLIALGYGTYRAFGAVFGTNSTDQHLTGAQHGTVRPLPISYRARLLSPETARQISLRTRVTEWTSAMAAAVPMTAVITAGVALLTSMLDGAAQAMLFGTSVLLASWAVLTIGKFQEGTANSPMHRRSILLVGGIIVGALAFQLQQSLFVELAPAEGRHHAGAPLAEIGALQLATPAGEPTLAGFAAFFAALFASRRWWWQTDNFRKDQFRIGTVLLTVLIGGAWASLLDFPLLWGATLAAAMSSVVQLSAAWVPLEQRIALIDRSENQEGRPV